MPPEVHHLRSFVRLAAHVCLRFACCLWLISLLMNTFKQEESVAMCPIAVDCSKPQERLTSRYEPTFVTLISLVLSTLPYGIYVGNPNNVISNVFIWTNDRKTENYLKSNLFYSLTRRNDVKPSPHYSYYCNYVHIVFLIKLLVILMTSYIFIMSFTFL